MTNTRNIRNGQLYRFEIIKSKPPKTIDGAEVIEWAWSGEKTFGALRNESRIVATKIYGLTIYCMRKKTQFTFLVDTYIGKLNKMPIISQLKNKVIYLY